MSTIFEFTTSSSVAVSPSVHSTWGAGTAASGFVRRVMSTTDSGTSSNQETTESVALNQSLCQIMYVSPALAAQTISGTIDITTNQKVSATGSTDFAYHVYVVASDGTTVRGVLHDHTSSVIGVASSYGAVSDTGRAISSLAVSAGDYIVVEIGYEVSNTSSKTFGTQAGVGSITFSGTITLGTAPSSLAYPYSTYTPVKGYTDLSGTPTYSGGSPAPTFTVSAGSIPAGMSLNSSTGVISGTPTTATTYTPTIQASNALGSTTVALTFNVVDYDGTVTSLATCNTNLTTCNSDLSTMTTNYNTAQANYLAALKLRSWTLNPKM